MEIACSLPWSLAKAWSVSYLKERCVLGEALGLCLCLDELPLTDSSFKDLLGNFTADWQKGKKPLESKPTMPTVAPLPALVSVFQCRICFALPLIMVTSMLFPLHKACWRQGLASGGQKCRPLEPHLPAVRTLKSYLGAPG